MNIQKSFRLPVSKVPGESELFRKGRENDLNHPKGKVSPEKLFADLLKRQARRGMLDLTECQSLNIPAHLSRLDDLRELFRFALAHQYRETSEAVRSEAQLCQPYTLADWLACLEITRREHRAPSFINSRDTDLAAINRKLDTLAGLLATSPLIDKLLSETEAV